MHASWLTSVIESWVDEIQKLKWILFECLNMGAAHATCDWQFMRQSWLEKKKTIRRTAVRETRPLGLIGSNLPSSNFYNITILWYPEDWYHMGALNWATHYSKGCQPLVKHFYIKSIFRWSLSIFSKKFGTEYKHIFICVPVDSEYLLYIYIYSACEWECSRFTVTV